MMREDVAGDGAQHSSMQSVKWQSVLQSPSLSGASTEEQIKKVLWKSQ